jgi:hypothetical protein
MNRRKFLQLTGLTALAAIYKPTIDASTSLEILDAPTYYIYSHAPDGFLNIDIKFNQCEYDPKKMLQDRGSLNPEPVDLNEYTYKRGELRYTGGMAVEKEGYWETTYSFQYRPGGHNPIMFHGKTGEPYQIEILPYADTVNLIEKGVEDVNT